MNSKNSLYLLFAFAVLFSCQDKSKSGAEETVIAGKHLIPYNSPLLNPDDPNVAIVDFRKPEAYNAAHIPGAIQLYRNDFQDITRPYTGIRADRKSAADRLGRAGISDKQTIVVYDDHGSPDASRFWWLLNLYNYDRVYILDGGLGYWQKMGGEASNRIPEKTPVIFDFGDDPDKPLLIEKEDLLRHVTSSASKVFVLDARTKEEYAGTYLKEGAIKAGRIPKSIHIDWAEAIDYGETFTFKPIDQLEKIYGKMGASREDTIIVYCHTGVRSSHTAFVLTQLLDYKNVLNYDGSWVEWSHDENLPFEKDTITTLKK